MDERKIQLTKRSTVLKLHLRVSRRKLENRESETRKSTGKQNEFGKLFIRLNEKQRNMSK